MVYCGQITRSGIVSHVQKSSLTLTVQWQRRSETPTVCVADTFIPPSTKWQRRSETRTVCVADTFIPPSTKWQRRSETRTVCVADTFIPPSTKWQRSCCRMDFWHFEYDMLCQNRYHQDLECNGVMVEGQVYEVRLISFLGDNNLGGHWLVGGGEI